MTTKIARVFPCSCKIIFLIEYKSWHFSMPCFTGLSENRQLVELDIFILVIIMS